MEFWKFILAWIKNYFFEKVYLGFLGQKIKKNKFKKKNLIIRNFLLNSLFKKKKFNLFTKILNKLFFYLLKLIINNLLHYSLINFN